jgi:hypothetical protein
VSSNCTIFDIIVYTVFWAVHAWKSDKRRNWTETLMDLITLITTNFGLDSFN